MKKLIGVFLIMIAFTMTASNTIENNETFVTENSKLILSDCAQESFDDMEYLAQFIIFTDAEIACVGNVSYAVCMGYAMDTDDCFF